MDYLYSALLGIIQGLTEFWPISSSGHLVIAHEIFKFNFIDNLSFDVALHWGTLIALLIFFRKDIINYIIAFFKSFAKWDLKNNVNQRLAWYILIASSPAFIFGYFWGDKIEKTFSDPIIISFLLIVFGIFFIIFEKVFATIKDLDQLDLESSFVIGLAQLISFAPGVSRSGITILAGIAQKLKREAAARFSFLLSIPVVFGAGVKKIYDLMSINLTGNEWIILFLGFTTSLVVGYFTIKFLLKFLASHPLNIFGYYRIILGIIVILWVIFR